LKPAVKDSITVIVPSHPKWISVLRVSLAEMASKLGFTFEEIQDFKLALNEACANVIAHVYNGDPTKRITVTLSELDRGIEVRIRDFGPKPDPRALQSRDLDDLQPRGVGLFLMHSLTDEVEYNLGLKVGTELRLRKYARGRSSSSNSERRTVESSAQGGSRGDKSE